jgi:hypothetical protein
MGLESNVIRIEPGPAIRVTVGKPRRLSSIVIVRTLNEVSVAAVGPPVLVVPEFSLGPIRRRDSGSGPARRRERADFTIKPILRPPTT